jgi:hypothetical protein
VRLVIVPLLLLTPACATVPRRTEVVSLAARILGCPPEAITVRVGPIDQICSDRAEADDTTVGPEPARTGPCLAWTALEPQGEELVGWIAEGCGHVDRYAAPHEKERSRRGCAALTRSRGSRQSRSGVVTVVED